MHRVQQSESWWCWRPDTTTRHRSAGRIIAGEAAGLHKQVQAGKWECERGGWVPALSLLSSGEQLMRTQWQHNLLHHALTRSIAKTHNWKSSGDFSQLNNWVTCNFSLFKCWEVASPAPNSSCPSWLKIIRRGCCWSSAASDKLFTFWYYTFNHLLSKMVPRKSHQARDLLSRRHGSPEKDTQNQKGSVTVEVSFQ